MKEKGSALNVANSTAHTVMYTKATPFATLLYEERENGVCMLCICIYRER